MQLIWFRQDLRIHDHAALWHTREAGPCIALVVLSPKQWQVHNDALIKIDFYLRQLNYLKNELATLNIPLVILTIPLWKDLPNQLLSLCQNHNIQAVHADIELGVNELKRDAQTQQLLEKNNIRFELYHDRTIFPVGSIRNKTGHPYQVFGAFKKQCYEKLSISLPQCYPTIEVQKPIPQHNDFTREVPQLSDIYSNSEEKVISENLQNLWQIGEHHAWELLDEFIENQVEYYHIERDFPNLNSTSKLAAYLNIGILSIRQCLQALFRHSHGCMEFENNGQQIWLNELLWREFYQHILFDYPRVSKNLPFKLDTQRIVWRNAPEDLQAWQHGQTGIPIVDAGMRQLLATGWMHNRVRMICAMFLSKNLLIDWRLGESWFMQHLIDSDLAANNGGWQWCASTGTDAAPYFRIFNPVSQSQKFDANGDYIRQWVPEISHLNAKQIHEPYAKNPQLKLDYPKPIVDLKSSRVRAIEAFKHLS
ncbi:DNA photolyase family protein [Acinetobacter indicus]|uniref:cryptochrome/photolyase family protein n=1 Tax=Acinetobacter TaxID=469 RepID=UPI0015D20688|nr:MULTISPECIES: deoxyribodipyrimidine photo-lyase [Acinetobacter]MCP0916965.1 DNA photolyase family protein [Acinetobacter indicus]MCP0920078.1 DNA photolyase family protein [Acinetobacter indicus]MCP0922745.1 DNA photolyase family protein [Acinetobacter indicus]QSQ92961.1 deoxyribodipyrimidine photo-lyase [Acinetobacter indicus]UNW10350.1 DNA photolyase family protein [Acinetobacter indicus]